MGEYDSEIQDDTLFQFFALIYFGYQKSYLENELNKKHVSKIIIFGYDVSQKTMKKLYLNFI